MKGEESRVFWSGHQTRGNKDREGEGERCIGLAMTKVCQGCLEVFGVGELLLLIHQRLCIHS